MSPLLQRGSSGAGLAYVCLTVTTFCWGLNAVFSKLAVGEVSPMLLVTIRWALVTLLVFAMAHKDVRRDWQTLKASWKFLFAMGALGYTAFNALFYVAAYTTDALNIGIVQGSVPVFVIALSFLFLKTTVTRIQLAGVVVTLVGVIVVASGGDPARLASLAINPGDIFMIIACFLYAGYTVGLRKRPPVSAMGMFAFMAGAAFMVTLPLAAAEMALGKSQAPTPFGWMILGLIALLPSFLAQICFMKGVELIGPARAGVFVNLVPVFASGLAVAILGENFQLFHAIALVLVLGGIWIAEKGKPKADPTPNSGPNSATSNKS